MTKMTQFLEAQLAKAIVCYLPFSRLPLLLWRVPSPSSGQTMNHLHRSRIPRLQVHQLTVECIRLFDEA